MIRGLYNSLFRPFLPEKIAVFNGVAVRGKTKLFDTTDVIPDYKEPNVAAIRTHVEAGDEVITVGGGIGVTGVVAARQVGTQGAVQIYEASLEQVDVINETLRLNKVDEQATTHHAVVGSIKSAGGKLGDPAEIDPTDLPECDVLEMDCEGAEIPILNAITIRPETIIVETHPRYDSTTHDVLKILNDMRYDIVSRQLEQISGDVLIAKYTV